MARDGGRRDIVKLIKAARLDGFGGRCMGVAVAINRVLFDGKGEYWVASNDNASDVTGGCFVGHVAVKYDGKFYDAAGEISRDALEAWGQVDHTDPDWESLSEEEALDSTLLKFSEREVLAVDPDRTKIVLKDATKALRETIRPLKENPHHPSVHEILERRFPLDPGFWSFEVAKQAGDDQDFGYLAPLGVVLEALPGETVVEIPYKYHEDEEETVRSDFSGALAVFTSKPIPADKVIEFGLYPDFHALPHFLLEIVGDADHIELTNNSKYRKGAVALIHRDTYPEHERTHKGRVHEYRISYFDKHGPEGHRNGTLLELVKDALGHGYRVLSPGALDRLYLEKNPRLSAGHDPAEFDPRQLALGTQVELEHTDDRAEARRIAMDHLVEDPRYYTKLRKAGL